MEQLPSTMPFDLHVWVTRPSSRKNNAIGAQKKMIETR